MTDQFKPLNTWRYHEMWVSVEQCARIAHEGYELLIQETHYSTAPLLIVRGDNQDMVELLPRDAPALLDEVKQAQKHTRYMLIRALEEIGMVADAGALRYLDASHDARGDA